MTTHTPADRAAFYHLACPDWPAPRTDARWLDGIWVQGNNYQGTGYHGSYPSTYLKRVMALFPDAQRVLHLFSGSLPRGPYVRFDRLDGADVVGDAEQLSVFFARNTFDLVIADPPYATEDAHKYGAPRLVNRREVFKQVHQVLEPGGVLVWLDLALPMFAKTQWHLWGLIGLVGSTNHKIRLASMFTRLSQPTKERPMEKETHTEKETTHTTNPLGHGPETVPVPDTMGIPPRPVGGETEVTKTTTDTHSEK